MKKLFLTLVIVIVGFIFTSCTPQVQTHVHTLQEVYIAPTCKVAGVRYFKCACLYTTPRENIPALGHNYVERFCTRCNEQKNTNNLEFTLSEDKKYYIVTGMGECTDPDVVIPRVYKLLPVSAISERAFYNNDLLNSIYIPSTITTMGKEVFSYCDNLKTVRFETGSPVKYIEDSTFTSCENLVDINLPEGLLSIGNEAFILCSKLSNIIIPETVNRIGVQAFNMCSSLESINLPEGIKYVENSTFSGCTSLKTIEFPTSIERIEEHAFEGCISLKKIVIPINIKKVEAYSFSKCSALKEVVFAEKGKVKTIAEYAFWQCVNLTTIILPETITTIDRGSFSGCTSLETINIPSSVNTINEGAFYECTSMMSIIIPSSVQKVGYGTFTNCENIKIYCEAEALPSGWHIDWNPDNYQVEWSYQN